VQAKAEENQNQSQGGKDQRGLVPPAKPGDKGQGGRKTVGAEEDPGRQTTLNVTMRPTIFGAAGKPLGLNRLHIRSMHKPPRAAPPRSRTSRPRHARGRPGSW